LTSFENLTLADRGGPRASVHRGGRGRRRGGESSLPLSRRCPTRNCYCGPRSQLVVPTPYESAKTSRLVKQGRHQHPLGTAFFRIRKQNGEEKSRILGRRRPKRGGIETGGRLSPINFTTLKVLEALAERSRKPRKRKVLMDSS